MFSTDGHKVCRVGIVAGTKDMKLGTMLVSNIHDGGYVTGLLVTSQAHSIRTDYA